MTRLVRVLGGAALLAMAGCSSPQEQAAPSKPSASAASTTTATTISSTPTTSPSPTVLPAAADGTNLKACTDGTCEVQVSAAGPIRLPKAAGATLSVDSIDNGSVNVAFAPTGTDFSSGCAPVEACTNKLRAGIPGSLVAARAGATVTFNKVVVVVVAVVGTSAVLRISPA